MIVDFLLTIRKREDCKMKNEMGIIYISTGGIGKRGSNSVCIHGITVVYYFVSNPFIP